MRERRRRHDDAHFPLQGRGKRAPRGKAGPPAPLAGHLIHGMPETEPCRHAPEVGCGCDAGFGCPFAPDADKPEEGARDGEGRDG